MRHIIGFFLALAVGGAVLLGAGWGFSRFSALQSGQGLRTVTAWTSLHNVLPLAALMGTALLLGILLAVRRVSALATGLPGLALIGWSALVLPRGTPALTYIPLSGSRYATGFSPIPSAGELFPPRMAMMIPNSFPSRGCGHMQG